MHLDKISHIIVSLVLAADIEGLIHGVTPSEDPDNVPDHVPCAEYGFVPLPFNKVFDECLVELTFWFDNPSFSQISKIIDNMERNSGDQWHDISEGGLLVGRFQFFFVRSPSSGGRQGLRFITLFLKIRTTFNQDQC